MDAKATVQDPAMRQNTEGASDAQVLDLAAELVRREQAKGADATKSGAPAPATAPSDAEAFDAALPADALRLPISERTAQRIKDRQMLIAQLQQQIQNEQRAIDDIAGTVQDAADVDGNYVVVGIYTKEKGKPVLQLVPKSALPQLQANLAATQRAG